MTLKLSKIFLTLALLPSALMADIKPSQLFIDHMVIQRDTQAPVWGTADPGVHP